MNLYLIIYGAENEAVTFKADTPAHAIEQFCSWAPVSPDWDENRKAINNVFICYQIEPEDYQS